MHATPLRAARNLLSRLRQDRRGNVLMLTGLSIVPLVTATGMGVDYAQAARVQSKLNAAADAAALAAVSQPMMLKTTAEAKAMAEFVFAQQAGGIKDIDWDSSRLTVTITQTGATSNDRTATVTYTADSKNSFGRILGLDELVVGGTSKANATRAPNIDFYMMLDTSGSMALPATSAGLTQMYNKTGCAFACHQTDMYYGTNNGEGWVELPNENYNWCRDVTSGGKTTYTCTTVKKRVSYYDWAKSQGIPVRSDLVQEGVRDLVDYAKSSAAENGATYRMALAQFDKTYQNLIAAPGTLDAAKAKVADAKLILYCRNNEFTCGNNDNDTATRSNLAFDGALSNLPSTGGNGSNGAGDRPQAILFLITDGARDESRPGGKPEGPFDKTKCDAVKARGIRIAVLYTQYLKESLNAKDSGTQNWINSNFRYHIDPTDTLETGLNNCASEGLFYKVTTDGDISAALASLFRKAVATARLVQ